MSLFLLLLTFALTHLAAVISPGPSFIIVLRTSVSTSRGAGIAVAFGMGLGTLIWAFGAWFGLSALFALVPWLFTILKWAGAAFLIYLGVMLWRQATIPAQITPKGDRDTLTMSGAVRLGLLTQLANPKVALFFGSIFVAILPPDPSNALLAAIFLIVFVNEFLWYALVAIAMAARGLRNRYARAKPIADRITGTFLGALGLRLFIN